MFFLGGPLGPSSWGFLGSFDQFLACACADLPCLSAFASIPCTYALCPCVCFMLVCFFTFCRLRRAPCVVFIFLVCVCMIVPFFNAFFRFVWLSFFALFAFCLSPFHVGFLCFALFCLWLFASCCFCVMFHKPWLSPWGSIWVQGVCMGGLQRSTERPEKSSESHKGTLQVRRVVEVIRGP